MCLVGLLELYIYILQSPHAMLQDIYVSSLGRPGSWHRHSYPISPTQKAAHLFF